MKVELGVYFKIPSKNEVSMRIVLMICDHYWRVSESMCVVQVQFILKKSAIRGQNVHKLVNFYFSAVALAERTDHLFASSRKFIILSIASEWILCG